MSYKFNPFTGNFDLVNDESGGGGISSKNFSYYLIESGIEVTVPFGQEMLIKSDLMVQGDLMIHGNVIQLQDNEAPLFYTRIESNKNVTVSNNRLLLYKNNLIVEGNLRVNGLLAGV